MILFVICIYIYICMFPYEYTIQLYDGASYFRRSTTTRSITISIITTIILLINSVCIYIYIYIHIYIYTYICTHRGAPLPHESPQPGGAGPQLPARGDTPYVFICMYIYIYIYI